MLKFVLAILAPQLFPIHMKNRKSYMADAENKKNLFLLIGLTLSLALTLFFLEYRSYENGPGDLGKLSFDEDDEIAIITNRTPAATSTTSTTCTAGGNPNRGE